MTLARALSSIGPALDERVWVVRHQVEEADVIHEGVDENGNPYSWEEGDDVMTFSQVQAYDRLRYDEAARDAHLSGAERILASTLGG